MKQKIHIKIYKSNLAGINNVENLKKNKMSDYANILMNIEETGMWHVIELWQL